MTRLAVALAFASVSVLSARADPILDGHERRTPPSKAVKDVKASDPISLLGRDPVFLLSSGGDHSAPVSIRSDELEATESEGRRTLVFDRNVEVRKGELFLRTAHLEAHYRAGAKQPSRLRAWGGVLLREGGREARCARADYDQAAQRITCDGDAVLKDGDDEIRGDSIVFDLAARRVVVRGGTRVAVTPRAGGGGSSGLLEGLDSEGAVTIRADELQVWEGPEGRRIGVLLAIRGASSRPPRRGVRDGAS